MDIERITAYRETAVTEGDIRVIECLDEIARLRLAAQQPDVLHEAAIKMHRETIGRLQRDNIELASIREYLRELRDLHKACGELASGALIVFDKPDHPLRKLALVVERKLKTLAQK
jgi:hypothetical protein